MSKKNPMPLNEIPAKATDDACRVDFSDLAGNWTPDPDFDDVIAAQRQIDWEKWK